MTKASRLILVLAAAFLLSPMLKADDAAKTAAEPAKDAVKTTMTAKAAAKAPAKASTDHALLQAANELMDQGKLDEAIKAYEAMGELKSKKAETWRLNNWGLCLIKQDKFADAVPVLEKSVAVDPNNDIALRNLGAAYERSDQIDKAIETYKKAVEAAKASNGDSSKAENNLKMAEAKKGGAAAGVSGTAKPAAKPAAKKAAAKKAAPAKVSATAATEEKKADAPAATDKK
jgi:tetratricopeptide (TPR) repeat protein